MTTPIALLTDFGTRDPYVGVMKGVIAGRAPGVATIDLSHEIGPQDVAHGAYTLAVSAPYFPEGAVFCSVVDPGVGSARRAVGAEFGAWRFVGPDNGLLTWLLERWPVGRAVTLDNPRFRLPHPSATFHGRDLFAPMAAALATGVDLAELGREIAAETLARLPLPPVQVGASRVAGSVIHVDHFGNLVTNLTRAHLAPTQRWHVRIVGTGIAIARLSATFADVAIGGAVAYLGSSDFLELALRNGNAAAAWQVGVGTAVIAERNSIVER